MKKNILLSLLTFVCSIAISQDACYNSYMEALQDYNKGNYQDAQRKFVVVAQTCGDYSDVWNKLKNCNRQLSEKQQQQSSQITNLRSEKQQLETDKKKAETELKSKEDLLIQNKAMLSLTQNNLKNLQSTFKLAYDTIELLRTDTAALHREIAEWVQKEDALKTALEECVNDTVASNSDIRSLKSKLRKEESEKAKVEKQRADLEKENEKLQQQVNELQEEIKASKNATVKEPKVKKMKLL